MCCEVRSLYIILNDDFRARVSALACAPLAAVRFPYCGCGRSMRRRPEEVETARWGHYQAALFEFWSRARHDGRPGAPAPLSSVRPVTGVGAGVPRPCRPPPSPAVTAPALPGGLRDPSPTAAQALPRPGCCAAVSGVPPRPRGRAASPPNPGCGASALRRPG